MRALLLWLAMGCGPRMGPAPAVSARNLGGDPGLRGEVVSRGDVSDRLAQPDAAAAMACMAICLRCASLMLVHICLTAIGYDSMLAWPAFFPHCVFRILRKLSACAPPSRTRHACWCASGVASPRPTACGSSRCADAAR